MELSGTWRALPSDGSLHRTFAEPSLDDSGWEPIAVPSHWRSTPAFADADGPLLYRTHFDAPRPSDGERTWLVLDGLFYQGDVWLDGAYVGDTEGYFNRHTFEVTEDLRLGTDHVLGIEVTCAPQEDRTAKRNITGVFQHWDCIDPDWNPGGIWRDVRIETTGPVRARSLRVVCTDATAERAVLACRAEIDSDQARPVTLRTTVAGPGALAGTTIATQDDERPVAEGSNFVEWQLTVTNPALWWPHALGDQPLHELAVEVLVDGVVSHRVGRRTGFRALQWKRWTLSVNGERLFLKGANLAPTRMALADATEAELRRDIVLAKEANLDLVRVHGHVSRPELYRAADEEGMLVWQDFPLQWGYARGIRKQAKRQASAMVDMLGHRPSIAIWCGHNEPFALDLDPGREIGTGEVVRLAVGQELPTFNKTFLDNTVRRAIEKADPSRPVIAHSGVWPHPGAGGTDSHLYFGWYHGAERDLPAFARAFPRMVRFVSEFGAQAVPLTDGFVDSARWPDLDWERLERTHGLQRNVFERVGLDPSDFGSYEAWKSATQEHQATVLRHHIETLRRLKHRPTGGFCQFVLNDAHEAISWAVLDHERAPKPGYAALRDACRPVIVVCERPPAVVHPGQELALDVHVVSDLRSSIEGAVVQATVSWPDGSQTWRWSGDVPADGCVRVGTIALLVPDVAGDLRFDLAMDELTAGYRSRVAGAVSGI
jgi:beta-mannosidase